jgi:L-lysine 2,3-aminomutase
MQNPANPIKQMDSDDEVQEIDPPVIVRSGRKKYRRRILIDELDVRFCRRSRRINKDVEELKEQDQNANLDFIENSVKKMLLPDKYFYMFNFF